MTGATWDINEFSKYGVKIKVKFRSTEPLAELSDWKQSYGKRAITSALYMLALQDLTNVPFRVIDEINQGMDAKNEARFFDILCKLATGTTTPQYFLLTPKMLPPVDYPSNVEFHIFLKRSYVKVHQRDNAIATEDAQDDESSDGEVMEEDSYE